MSIRDQIRDRIKEKRLHLVRPHIGPAKRYLFVSETVNLFLFGPWSGGVRNIDELKVRAARLKAYLDAFIEGRHIVACMTPYKAKDAYLGRLAAPSDEVWDIRTRDLDPPLRVFGRFAEKDVFIGLSVTERPLLGNRNSPEWRYFREQCKTDWRNLFPAHNAVSGENINDYITTNVTLI